MMAAIAMAFLWLVGMVGLLAQLAGTAGIAVGRKLFAVALVIAIVIVVMRWRSFATRVLVSRAAALTLTLLLLPVVITLFFDTAITPLRDYDGRVTWMLKARAIAHEHSMSGPFFQGKTSRDAHSHYPLLMPLAAALPLEFAGEQNESAARAVYALTYVAFLLVLFRVLCVVGGDMAAAVIVGCVAWLPQFAMEIDGGMLSAYSELPLVAFTTLAIAAILDADAIALGFSLACVTCMKNEGSVIAAVLIAIAVMQRPRMRRVLIAAIFPAAAMLVLAFWRRSIPLEHDENYPHLAMQLALKLRNYPEAARELLGRMLHVHTWGVFWFASIIATATGIATRSRRATTFVLGGAAILFVYITSYAVTNWTIAELAMSSANRLLMHLVPFAAIVIAEAVARYTAIGNVSS